MRKGKLHQMEKLALAAVIALCIFALPKSVQAAEQEKAETQSESACTLSSLSKNGHYYDSDGNMVKSAWVKVKKTWMYFNSKGKNTKVYYQKGYSQKSKAGRLKIYKKGKWRWVKTGVYKINGSVIYFENGKRSKATCTYASSDTVSYSIVKGKALYKRKKTGVQYKMYERASGKWSLMKNTWSQEMDGEMYYLDENGISQYKLYTENYEDSSVRMTLWAVNASLSDWYMVKNSLVKIGDYYFCTDGSGMIYKSEGWHKLDDLTYAYTDVYGVVSQYVYYDTTLLCSVYKTTTALDQTAVGLLTIECDGQTVYYLIQATGQSTSGSQTIDGYIYNFDAYGQAGSRKLEGALYWDTDTWMKRVILTYLGDTGIYCNQFVAKAFMLAGETDPTAGNLAVRYTDATSGGIVIDETITSATWGDGVVTGTVTLSDGTAWQASTEITVNANITDFSYDKLSVGDVIVYYKDESTTACHTSIYLGKFASSQDVVNYLVKLGLSNQTATEYVKSWGTSYGNDGTYWCIHGGMGSNNQVYISNSTYCIPNGSARQYAKKIVHVIE